MAHALMLQGTGSNVGKSLMIAALCRLAHQRGLTVRPFKPQNMSNNAAVAEDGGEVGRAQWLQALACKVPVSVHMNPILLKPQTDMGSQIVVHGKVVTTAKIAEYQAMKAQLLPAIMTSFKKMCDHADLVLVEGAGSPAEINLRHSDIANMGFATKAGVPVCMVGDIDRGGVIASLVGTYALLPETDRMLICGFIINKFRGDMSLFDEGLQIIKQHTNWPWYGTVPWLKEVQRLPAEDSLAFNYCNSNIHKKLVIAIPVLQRISNFDDFDPLVDQNEVDVVMVADGERIPPQASIVILPGSKATISDLIVFYRNGWDWQLKHHVKNGGWVIGICGGYQMLGKKISDPYGVEGAEQSIRGLGLLDVETILESKKQVYNTSTVSTVYNVSVSGYEIHMGKTTGPDCQNPMFKFNGHADGAIACNGRIMGCYLHGLFNNDAFRAKLLAEFGIVDSIVSFSGMIDNTLDLIAERVRQYLDIDRLFKCAKKIS